LGRRARLATTERGLAAPSGDLAMSPGDIGDDGFDGVVMVDSIDGRP
jgi:hypothetical protein